MGTSPCCSGAEFVGRRRELLQVLHVLTARTLVDGCVELEENLVSSSSQVHNDAIKIANRGSLAEADGQTKVEK
jgi:hypothetical protein